MDSNSGFLVVAKCSDVAPGRSMLVEMGNNRILLSNVDGDFYAIGEACPHAGGPLSEGVIEGIEVECPFHGSRFNLKTGGVTELPALERVARYQVRVENGNVMVGPAEGL